MKESRMYSFLDSKNGFSINFLEGQKLIHDLVITHNINGDALSYYRNTVLTFQQMLNFLKAGETLGLYIDSEQPYFRFKMEMNASGQMRTLLSPEKFKQFPMELTGMFRLTKIGPKGTPYNSITKMTQTPSKQLINQVLKESYQTNSCVELSATGDQSLMITKMPAVNVNKEADHDDLGLNEYLLKNKKFILDLFHNCHDDISDIVQFFEGNNFLYIGSKEVRFHCSCSRERMIANLILLNNSDLDHIFDNKERIEVNCDYCHTKYPVNRSDLTN